MGKFFGILFGVGVVLVIAMIMLGKPWESVSARDEDDEEDIVLAEDEGALEDEDASPAGSSSNTGSAPKRSILERQAAREREGDYLVAIVKDERKTDVRKWIKPEYKVGTLPYEEVVAVSDALYRNGADIVYVYGIWIDDETDLAHAEGLLIGLPDANKDEKKRKIFFGIQQMFAKRNNLQVIEDNGQSYLLFTSEPYPQF